MTAVRLSQLQKRLLRWLTVDHQRTQGRSTRSHQDLVRALQGAKGNSSQRLRTLEARGWIGMSRSSGGKAASLSLTREGQKWAFQVAGRCDS